MTEAFELEAGDFIDSRIAVHDSDHVEAKLEYSLQPGSKDSSYRVESYFFIPRGLGINKQTYPAQQFYRDVQAHIRFKTPDLTLARLADAKDPYSPLGPIDDALGKLRRDPRNRGQAKALGHELRLFGCIVRHHMRDRVRLIRERVGALADVTNNTVLIDDVRTLIVRLCGDIDTVREQWRLRRAEFIGSTLPRWLVETYEWVDEFISLMIEERLTVLVKDIDDRPAVRGAIASARKQLRALVIAERNHRAGAGYPTVPNGDSQDEFFVYRRGKLKKFVMSVLWLEIDKQKDGQRVSQLGAGIAAGIAMFIAVALMIVQAEWFLMNSWGFVVTATIIYIFKDRIKDLLKHYFASQLGRWLADYNVKIRDPLSKAQIGRCRESFGFVAPSRLPEAVAELRRKNATSVLDALAKPEEVIRYVKEVRLSNRAVVERLHLQDFDVHDIIRFALKEMLARADDPVSSLPIYDEETDSVEPRAFPKVYHLNMVMVMHAGSSRKRKRRPVMERMRVVFDKHAIRRLEPIH